MQQTDDKSAGPLGQPGVRRIFRRPLGHHIHDLSLLSIAQHVSASAKEEKISRGGLPFPICCPAVQSSRRHHHLHPAACGSSGPLSQPGVRGISFFHSTLFYNQKQRKTALDQPIPNQHHPQTPQEPPRFPKELLTHPSGQTKPTQN